MSTEYIYFVMMVVQSARTAGFSSVVYIYITFLENEYRVHLYGSCLVHLYLFFSEMSIKYIYMAPVCYIYITFLRNEYRVHLLCNCLLHLHLISQK